MYSMNIDVSTQNTTSMNNVSIYNSNNLFYIDNHFSPETYKVVKINYTLFNTLEYKEIIYNINTFHEAFQDAFIDNTIIKNSKIIILIDVNILRLSTNVNAASMYSVHLINIIKYVNKMFNDNIYKCIIINYNEFEKGLILLFKTLLKHIDFVQKIRLHMPV